MEDSIYSHYGQFSLAQSATLKARLTRSHRRIQSMSSLKAAASPAKKLTPTAPPCGHTEDSSIKEKCQSKLQVLPKLSTTIVNCTLLLINAYQLSKFGFSAVYNITSFSQLVYLLTTCYYFTFIICENFHRPFLKPFIAYTTFPINGGIWLNYWLVASRPDQLLAQSISQGIPLADFLKLGTRATLFYPIFMWWLFHIFNRNIVTLLIWETEALLPNLSSLRSYRTYNLLSPLATVFIWSRFKSGIEAVHSLSPQYGLSFITDLPTLSSTLTVLSYSLFISVLSFCWVSFITFQYRGIVWKAPCQSGYLVLQEEGKSVLCELS